MTIIGRLLWAIPILAMSASQGLAASPQAAPTVYTDVPSSYWAATDIGILHDAGMAIPCNPDGTLFCPDYSMSRRDLAQMVERGTHDGVKEPPYPLPNSPTFADVPLDSAGASWIESLWKDNLASACGSTPQIFCPDGYYTRAEATVQFLRMKYGPDYTPPRVRASAFKDVSRYSPHAAWIQAALLNGITNCNTDMQALKFRPEDALTRAEAACMFVSALGMTPSPSPAPSPTSEPTSDPTVEPTFTAEATSTAMPATATLAPSTPTSTPKADSTPVPVAGELCPQWVHDRYVTTGPDGKIYPTWHPQIDPQYHCYFDHEHGDDPRTSLANSTMPAFGYIGTAIGKNEPHEGFKVYVVNRGDKNDEGRTAQVSSRIVFHMGTGGPKRFDTEFHSLQYDMVAPDGHFVHVAGMADTGVVGSICDRNASAPNRTVMTLPGSGCATDSLYEIWGINLQIGSRLSVLVSVAVFDPITIMDPSDHSRLVYTADVPEFQQFGHAFYSCSREAYHGPIYWRNAGGSKTYHTDPYGNISSTGEFVQTFSAVNDIGIPMSNDQTQFKKRSNHCASGLSLHN
jgi:hypothetical protein